MERKTPDGEFVYVRTKTMAGLVSIHATSLILTETEDTLYGEIVATTDEAWNEGEEIEIPVRKAVNDVDYAPFFAE